MDADLVISPCKDDLQEKLLNMTRTRQSLSLFDLDMQIGETSKNLTKCDRNIHEKLQQEINDWQQLIKCTKNQVEKLIAEYGQDSQTIISKSTLTTTQLKYLEGFPNFQEFLDDSVKFQIKGYNYLQEYTKTMEMKNALDDHLTTILNKVCFDKIDELLY